MTTVAKLMTYLILGALFVMVLTHSAGFSMATMSGGTVLDNTLNIMAGTNSSAGSKGTFSNGSSSVSVY